jgi:hypothetical protein
MTLVRQHNMNLLFSAAAAAMAVLALGVMMVYRASVTQQFRQQAAANCKAIETLKKAIRDGLAEREAIAAKQPELDVASIAAIHAYYQHAIGRYAPTEC